MPGTRATDVHFNRLSCLQPISPGFKHSTELPMTWAWGIMPSQCDAACAWAQRTSQVLLLCPRTAAGWVFRGLNLPKPKQRWTHKDNQHSGESKVFLPWGNQSMRQNPCWQMALRGILAEYNRTRALCSLLMQDPGCRTIIAVVTRWHFPTSCPARTVIKSQQTLECLRPQNFWEVLSQHCMCSSYSHSFVKVLYSHLPINISLSVPQTPPPGSTPAAAAYRFPSSKATQEPRAALQDQVSSWTAAKAAPNK